MKATKNKLGKGKYTQAMALDSDTCWFEIYPITPKTTRGDKALKRVCENSGATTKEIAALLNVSLDTAMKDLRRLEKVGKIYSVTGAHNTLTWREVSDF
jgi:hypothetical protein